jgi:hypothetical protein
MDRPPVTRLTEVVRRDRLEYFATHESGQCYSKDGAHPVRNYARLALERGRCVGDYVHYDVEYAHGRHTPGYGMLFPGAGTPGLQSIEGEFKRFLLEGSPAYDVDQANAIPTLVLHDARSYGHEMHQLGAYNGDREGWLAHIVQAVPSCTRDAAKGLVLRMIFGGGIAGWEHEHGLKVPEDSEAHDSLTVLAAEIKRFVRWWDSSEHADAVRAADTCTDAELTAGGTIPSFRRFGIAYQHKETLVTLVISEALAAHGMTTRVLCHDGLVADGGADHSGRPLDPGIDAVRALLHISEQAVKDRMGYDVQLELKPLAPKSGFGFEEYVQRKWQRQTPAAPTYDKKLGQIQDREFAEHLIAAKPGLLFKQCVGDDQYAFWSHDGSRWVQGWSQIGGWCAELFPGCPYGASAAGIRRIRDYMTLACPALVKAPVFNRVPNGMVPCAGGVYYDAVKRTSVPIPLDHYVTVLWDRPPPAAESIGEEHMASVRALVCGILPHDGLRASVMPRLAYDLLTVGNPHKAICFFIGDGDNGKTTLMKIVKTAAVPGWVACTRANNFTGRAGGNEQTDWLAKLDCARIVYTEEPRRGDCGSLDSEWLKELRGDSDVSCRKMYGGEREMQISFSLYFMANHMPQTAHADAALTKSLVICDLPGKFVDDPAAYKNANLSAPWKEYVQPVDKDLKAKFTLPEMRSALMLYFCEEYRTFVLSGCSTFAPVPAEFAKWKDEVSLEKDLISEAFYAAYEIDALSTHPVPTREILMQVRSMNPELKINAEAIGGFMKREFIDTKHAFVLKKRTKHSMVWTGLKNASIGMHY